MSKEFDYNTVSLEEGERCKREFLRKSGKSEEEIDEILMNTHKRLQKVPDDIKVYSEKRVLWES